jgi:outer membrane protein OmpA-like peptidoglycan-associated protein
MKYLVLIISFFLLSLPTFAQEQFSVFFESDQYDLTKAQIDRLEKWTVANPQIKIVGVYGFTDEDGTSGYNDTLATKRIDHVISRIRGKINIREDFKTRSFGELHQQSKIKSENRKVTLYYLELKDLPREEEILGLKKEVVAKPKSRKKYPAKILFDLPNGKTEEYRLDIEFMNKVDMANPGEKLKLDNLNFQLNTFAIMKESRGKLYELLMVLQSNPNLKVEIHGHLCCMPVDRVDLSTQRAKAIYNFLVNNDIEKSRLSYKGFGSTQPIYPLPEKDEAQRAANRRVELLIVAN